jgi:CMP-N,N'-diacetyllegionaminic acid synthase
MSLNNLYIVSIIPARSGSKSVVNKNLRELCGVELLNWSIRASLKSKEISRTLVSTNSNEYAKKAIEMGAEAPFLRPESISQDNSTDLEMILHSIDYFKSEGRIPDLIVHLRPTSPLRNPHIVSESIKLAAKNFDKVSAIRSIQEMSETAYKSFEISNKGNLVSVFTRSNDLDKSNLSRQVYPKTFVANGYVDVLFSNYILKERKIHGDNVLPILTESILEIDTEFDLIQLQSMKEYTSNYYKLLFGE